MACERQTATFYRKFMGDITDDYSCFHDFQEPSKERLKKYRVNLCSNKEYLRRQRKFDIKPTFVGFGATMAAYQVDLGRFTF